MDPAQVSYWRARIANHEIASPDRIAEAMLEWAENHYPRQYQKGPVERAQYEKELAAMAWGEELLHGVSR